MFYGPDKECTDLAFYVDRAVRGGSVAFRMLSRIDWWASDLGAERIAIGIHNGINHEQGVRFFSKLGYKPQGILMEKSVH
jgi:GNAT superfamily N-acetyltransferase